MTYDFRSKVAVVTGAGSGIGRAVAIKFASCGAKVALVDIDENKAETTQRMITKKGGNSIVVQANLSQLAAINRMVDKVLKQFGDIDILANMAAIFPPSPVMMVTEEHWDRVIGLDLKGVFFTCQAVLKHMMEKKKGAIVNIASGAAHYPVRHHAAYSAAKGGLLAMSRVMALEAASNAVRVNVVSPGPTDTEGTRTIWAGQELPSQVTLLGRLLTAEEVAEAIIWVCSDKAGGVIGATINVNGGNYMP